MSNLLIDKIINKAVKNGYSWNKPSGVLYYVDEEAWLYKDGHAYFTSLDAVIFSHDFAKAFWGEFAYIMRLRQLVLEKDRIAYMGKFL